MTCGFCSVKECALFFFCQRDQSSKKDKIEKKSQSFFFTFAPLVSIGVKTLLLMVVLGKIFPLGFVVVCAP